MPKGIQTKNITMQFNHLHCHTQYSLLDGAASINQMYKKASQDGMKAIAITDHGNMFGVFSFVAEAAKHKGIKPIVGCEFYLVADRHKKQFTKDDKDRRFHQLFLAKNTEGYQNLVKMCSLGYIEGLYSKYPRIDKELVLKYSKGLIATTCCIGAMVPQTILKKGEAEARKEFEWWLNIFGEDYYIELQRHNIKEQETVNLMLLQFAKDYGVKIIASNDSHYIDQKDANAHDILLCINTGEKQSTPKMNDFIDDSIASKNYRFAFPNNEFYFKTTNEMLGVFNDLPQAIDNTNEIVDKVDHLKLKQDILLPHFQIPDGFEDQDAYLKHLTYTGAKERYQTITAEIEERINFELFTIKTMGFAGYFLIVSDFIIEGKKMGVFVGPGRGSAAGSAVAYCIGITNIDPIKYNLLFERFLNPERKSMPDIDTDFDDIGRQKVIDYVVQKYGKQQVAHITTYGTMAAKMSIKDVARVMELPLNDANNLAKLVSNKPGIKLNRLLTAPLIGENSLSTKENLQSDDINNAKQLREILSGNNIQAQVLKEALILEGSVRGTGIHAAGIIIAPKNLYDIIPVYTSKETELVITQFEGGIIEDAGVIKMDFLGLKTLTIIKDALQLIEQNYAIKIDIDKIPLEDKKTYELFQRGECNATFQFESAGMQKYLKELKPDRFEDLIAMNALYRPGPLEFIPSYIARKNKQEEVTYEIPESQEFLEDTYGITVYQEQVMLLSQKLANFTKGDADVLRKAMGKKQLEVLNKMKTKFLDGCKTNNLDTKKCEKMWSNWEAFASYAFNKSHATCYAFVAFQTAYLKAHYPAEYMAAVLTNNLGNIEKITFFMEECRRMNLEVKGPDINESEVKFTVNKNGKIRFGLGAIKGVGEVAVKDLVNERKKNGDFKSIFDITKRVSLRTINKKILESLAMSGTFDSFNAHRYQYFYTGKDNQTIIEKSIRYGNQQQQMKESGLNSLFGGTQYASDAEPTMPNCPAWSLMEELNKEKEVVGIYISGHPFNPYQKEIEAICNANLDNMENLKNKPLKVAVIVTENITKIAKNGKNYAQITLEDNKATTKLSLFNEDYEKFAAQLPKSALVLISAKYLPRWNSTSEFELKITQVQPLENIKRMVKKVIIDINLATITPNFINELHHICNKHTENGSIPVVFKIIHENNQLELINHSLTVNTQAPLFTALDYLNVNYKLIMNN